MFPAADRRSPCRGGGCRAGGYRHRVQRGRVRTGDEVWTAVNVLLRFLCGSARRVAAAQQPLSTCVSVMFTRLLAVPFLALHVLIS